MLFQALSGHIRICLTIAMVRHFHMRWLVFAYPATAPAQSFAAAPALVIPLVHSKAVNTSGTDDRQCPALYHVRSTHCRTVRRVFGWEQFEYWSSWNYKSVVSNIVFSVGDWPRRSTRPDDGIPPQLVSLCTVKPD